MSKIIPYLSKNMGVKREEMNTGITNNSQFSTHEQLPIDRIANKFYNQQSEEICEVCLVKKNEYYCFGKCLHLFCKKCIQQYLKEKVKSMEVITCMRMDCREDLIRVKAEPNGHNKYVWQVMSKKDKKKIEKHLVRMAKLKEKC